MSSGPPPAVKRTLVTCSNPSCERYGQPGEKAPLKCASCKSARYCDRGCQRRHWRQHKEFCKIWASSSARNGHTSVAQIKLKMAYLIWLLRGIPDYSKCMFEEYGYWRKRGKRGFIEFKFYSWQQLDDTISFIEKLEAYGEFPFIGMPGTPSYSPPSVKQFPLPLRRIPPKDCAGFNEAVQNYMRFTGDNKRPNLQRALDVAMKDDDLFVISISVILEDTYSANIYDFLYRSVSWQPSDRGPAAAVPVPVR